MRTYDNMAAAARSLGGWSALLLALLLAGCSAQAPGIDYAGQNLDVVDMHLHTGHWEDIRAEGQRTLASFFPFPLGLQPESTSQSVLSPEGLVRELDRASIGRGMVLAVYAPKSVGITPNEDVIELVAAQHQSGEPRLFGMASLRFDRWDEAWQEQLDQLSAALDEPGMLGVKLAPPHQHFRLDDERLHGLWEVAAAHQAPVYVHTGPSPFPGTRSEDPYTQPSYLEEDIAAHPDTIFVLGHMGYDFLNEKLGALSTCVDLAARYPNVYLEPSALGSRSRENGGENLRAVMAAVRDAGVIDRLIYGSDGPQSPGFLEKYLSDTIAAMQEEGYSAEEASSVLSGNFDRVYRP